VHSVKETHIVVAPIKKKCHFLKAGGAVVDILFHRAEWVELTPSITPAPEEIILSNTAISNPLDQLSILP